MSELLTAALEYARLGYKVFPCIPGKKFPAIENGRNGASCDEAQVEEWWERWPNANIGIETDALVVIDVDGKDNNWPEDPDCAGSLIDAPTSITANGGRHTVFKQPPGKKYRSTASRLADAVDTRAGGGYIVAPPSVLEDGKQYQWVDGLELSCPVDALPEPPQWLIEQLDDITSEKRARDIQGITLGDGNPIPDGLRNDTLTRLAGGMRRQGQGYNSIFQALLQENLDRCCPPLCESEVERVARSVCKYEPDQITVALIESHLAQARPDAAQPETGAQDPGAFPEHLLKVPGWLGDFSRYCLDYAHRPQPVLALGAAVSGMSLLIGRKIIDEQGTRPNLYGLAVAPSSAGKEAGRSCLKDVLFRAQASHMVGEGIASHAGLVSSMARQPAKLWLIDEVGKWMCGLGAAGERAPHLQGIITNLMKFYSSAHSTYYGDAYADYTKGVEIIQPFCVLFGSSTPETLYKGLTVDSLQDGFLSRVLIWEAPEEHPRMRDPICRVPPPSVIDVAQAWTQYCPGGGNLASFIPKPQEIRYQPDAADLACEFAFKTDDALRSENHLFRSLWGRAPEKARKLAIIHAASMAQPGASFTIGWDSVAWAVELTDYLTRRLIHLSTVWVSDGAFDGKCKRIIRLVIAGGEEGLTQTKLYRATQSMAPKERLEAIQSLVQSGQIFIDVNSPSGKGRPMTTYKLAKYLKQV